MPSKKKHERSSSFSNAKKALQRKKSSKSFSKNWVEALAASVNGRNLNRRIFFAQIKESEREEENKNLSRRK